jgi:hypothetical protein
MDPIYVCFVNKEDEETIYELSQDFLDEANEIPYFKFVYGTLNFEEKVFGSSTYPIKFSYLHFTEFMIILNMLKLKNKIGVPFENKHITYHALLNYDWQYLWLPTEYLKAIEDMTTESVIKCMCACSQLSLCKLRQLFIYRIIYLLHKDYYTTGSTMESLVKHASHEDISVFQKICNKLINADSKYQIPTPVRESRSKSF